MKNFFKKINRNQEPEQEDLNLDYSDFYMGKDSHSEDRRSDRAPPLCVVPQGCEPLGILQGADRAHGDAGGCVPRDGRHKEGSA